jgi:hypothetical protein
MNKIGIYGFEEKQLLENFEELARAVLRKRPESVKGKYFSSCIVKTGSGRPVKVALDKLPGLEESETSLNKDLACKVPSVELAAFELLVYVFECGELPLELLEVEARVVCLVSELKAL